MITELIEHLDEMTDDRGYTEFPKAEIVRFTGAAVLVTLEADDEEVWFPYSQLRHLDGEIYASEWIMKQKGLA